MTQPTSRRGLRSAVPSSKGDTKQRAPLNGGIAGTRGALQLPPSDASTEWQKFLTSVKVACEELRNCSTGFYDCWFRGSPHASHNLMPSLFRGYKNPNADDAWDHIWQLEQDLYWEFASRARELHNVVPSDWDILFAMQHYGVPTRLLDWTETLGVAVYFALHSFEDAPGVPATSSADDPPCIWILNPYEMNTRNWGAWTASDLFDPKNLGWDSTTEEYWSYSDLLLEGGVDWDHPIAVYPQQRTTRMQVQRGWFTVHGDRFKPLESRKSSSYFLRKIVLPPAAEQDAREFLLSAGLELFTLFPDLPNLALHLARYRNSHRAEFQQNG